MKYILVKADLHPVKERRELDISSRGQYQVRSLSPPPVPYAVRQLFRQTTQHVENRSKLVHSNLSLFLFPIDVPILPFLYLRRNDL